MGSASRSGEGRLARRVGQEAPNVRSRGFRACFASGPLVQGVAAFRKRASRLGQVRRPCDGTRGRGR